MTGAAGHLVSHSGYGSLIVPGVLLKGERKTPASPESPLRGARREAKKPIAGRGRPAATAPSLGQSQRVPRPAARLDPAAPLPVSSTTPSARPAESRHSSRAGCGRKNPKASHPKERKQKGCSSRRGDIGHVGVQEATRHPFSTPTR